MLVGAALVLSAALGLFVHAAGAAAALELKLGHIGSPG